MASSIRGDDKTATTGMKLEVGGMQYYITAWIKFPDHSHVVTVAAPAYNNTPHLIFLCAFHNVAIFELQVRPD